MTYMALYREWRPQTFREVAGQEHITRTLLNALKAGRVAHAYLLCGPRGTGKTSTAKVLARALNCLEPDGVEPCGRCSNCLEIQGGTSMDVIEIDAASNRGIDEVRELRENIRYAPTTGRKRVYIIDEVHMLTDPAFNALLKTLEEPPGHAIFVLATTEPHKVPVTILSRCQRFDFHRIDREVMSVRLREVAGGSGIEVEDGALDLIIKAADGGLRDALSMLDQAASFSDRRVTAEDVHRMLGTVREEVLENFQQLITGGRAGECLALLGELFDQGTDLRLLAREIAAHMRGALLKTLAGGSGHYGESETAPDKLLEALKILTAVDQEMRWSTQPRVLLEVALVRCARICGCGGSEGVKGLNELAARVAELEERMAKLAGDGSLPRGQGWSLQETKASGETDTVYYSQSQKPSAAVTVTKPVKAGDGDNGPGRKRGTERGEIAAGAVKPDPTQEVIFENQKPREATGESVRPVWEEGRKVAATSPAEGVPTPPESGPNADNSLEAGENAGKTDGGVMLLQKVTDCWNDIIDTVRRSKNCGGIYTYLTGGAGSWPSSLSGGVLTVSFWEKDENSFFALHMMESENNKDVLQRIVRSVIQEELIIKFMVSKQKPPAAGCQEKPPVTHDEAAGLFEGEEQELPEDISFDD